MLEALVLKTLGVSRALPETIDEFRYPKKCAAAVYWQSAQKMYETHVASGTRAAK